MLHYLLREVVGLVKSFSDDPLALDDNEKQLAAIQGNELS